MRKDSNATAVSTSPTTRSWSVLLNSVIVMIGFVLSRILGLIRDSIFNDHFGTSATADVYRAAFNLPDLLYLVIIGGALGSAFIPIFTELREKSGSERAWQLTNEVMTAALITLAIVSVGIGIFAEPLLGLIYPRFTPEQLALATYLTRIFLLSPLLLGLGGLAMAALNATDRFTLPALAPIFYNAAIILGIVVLAPLWPKLGWQINQASGVAQADGTIYSIEGVAWGVVIGALCYLALQVPGLMQGGFRPRFMLNFGDSAVRRIGKLMGPRVFGQAAMQINLIVMSGIASILGDGRVAALTQAYQLMLLPHGIFALSLATVMFPQLARAYNNNNMSEFGTQMRSTLRNVWWMVVPSAVGLAILSVPIIRLLFERGQFDNESTYLVASALIWYAAALPAFAASEILIRTFYAMQDTWTPVIVGLLTIGLNVALSALFVLGFGWNHASLAGAFAITNNLELLALLWLLHRKLGHLDPNRRLRRSFGQALGGAAVMGVSLYGLSKLIGNWQPFLTQALAPYSFSLQNILILGLWLIVAGIIGAGIYIGIAAMSGAEEWHTWQQRLLRGRLARKKNNS